MSAKTEAPPEGQAPPQGDQAKKGDDQAPTMADVRREIREEIEDALKPIKDMLGGRKSGDPQNSDSKSSQTSSGEGGGPPDLGAMVDAALAKVLGERDNKTREDAHAKAHERIAAMETKPVDRPRRSRWLGNIYD